MASIAVLLSEKITCRGQKMISEKIYNHYFSCLLSGNKRECTAITQELIAQKVPVYDLYINLFQASMYQIGKLWESNKISVAVEHMTTAITEGLLNLVYPIIFSDEHIDKSAVIACVPNEYHQLGAKIIADIFELNHWDGYFLGSNTPAQELLRVIDEKRPDLLGLSMSIYFSLPALEQTIQVVKSSYPELEIIVGGQGFLWGGREVAVKYSNVNYVDSLTGLEEFIKRMAA